MKSEKRQITEILKFQAIVDDDDDDDYYYGDDVIKNFLRPFHLFFFC